MADMKPQTLEVLSPAGDPVRLRAAVDFGAHAVYLAGKSFGMRASPLNFSMEELAQGVCYAHARGVRVYLTVNTLPHNREADVLPEFLQNAAAAGVDAMIVTDLGAMALIRRLLPQMELHVSVQAGVTNYLTARAFYELGAKRVVLARELSLKEIAEIAEKTPPGLELEAFVHGAVCMSYSGRCLLSDYLTGRDPNRGECAQPCRWKYALMEESRPGEYLPILEDEDGSYILNAEDLNMLPHIPALYEAGVSSLKIEGRAKTEYYTAVTANAYRAAVDSFLKHPSGWSPEAYLLEELCKVSHRPYGTGFYFGKARKKTKRGGYIREYEVAALAVKYDATRGLLTVSQRNKFLPGAVFDVLEPGVQRPWTFTAGDLYDDKMQLIQSAPHPGMSVQMYAPPVQPGAFLRQKRNG